MELSKGVLLLTKDRQTAKTVTSALESSKRLVLEEVCTGMAELMVQIEDTSAVAVVVDIDPDPSGMLRDLDRVVGRFSDVVFIVLATQRDSDLILEAMQIGARHFLAKDSITSDLAGVLKRLVPDSRTPAHGQGALVTVLSASGGCGATTLAINLANELGLESTSPALVVDMDYAYGATAGYLGLSGQYGLENILTHEGLIDDELLLSTATVYSPSLHVLLSPVSIYHDGPVQLQCNRLRDVLETFRRTYHYTIIDAARVPLEVASMLAAASKMTLLTFQLNVKDITSARSILEALSRREISEESILPVANRYRRRNQIIVLEEAEKALGMPVAQVSNDFSGALKGITLGQPLADAAPRSIVRRDVQRLASRVVSLHTMDLTAIRR